jgi:hypothetical protein
MTDLTMRSLTPQEQQELAQRMERKQMREFMNVSAAFTFFTRTLANCAPMPADVLQHGPALFRRLHQRLLQQIAGIQRRELCDAMCG